MNLKVYFNRSILYLLLTVTSIIFFLIVTKSWSLNFHVPFYYYDDNLMDSMLVKSIIDTGWYIHNPFTGAPNGFNFADFSFPYHIQFLIIKLLTLFSNDYAF